jgi:nicotinamide-nucleotide amidase
MTDAIIGQGLLQEAEALLAACRERGVKLATAESCTGGLIAATLTAIAGSSDVLDRGFVTYSNAAKAEILGVSPELIAAAGAVSEEVARRMAEGALRRSAADVAVSVTGVAGPGGGSAEKPVGLVWFAVAARGAGVQAERRLFPGDRTAVRRATVARAFDLIRAML